MNEVFARPVGRGPDGDGPASRAPGAPVAAYSAGMVLGATGTAVLVALIGRAAGDASIWALLAGAGGVTVLAAIAQARGRVSPLPERRAQVPQRWLAWPATRVGAAFGLMLGASVFTLLHHATIYALAAALLVAGSVPVAIAVGAIYGAARALHVVGAWAHPGDHQEQARRVDSRAAVAARALPAVSLITFALTAVSV